VGSVEVEEISLTNIATHKGLKPVVQKSEKLGSLSAKRKEKNYTRKDR